MSELQHQGVKGMHWGVRRNANRPGGADGIPDAKDKKRGKIGKHWDSLKRERSWKSDYKNVHNMSTKDIQTISKRINLENSFKDLARGKAGTKKDKADYLRRHEMSDEELKRKITRLQAKEGLHTAMRKASKEQRELGYKVAQTAGSLGVRYVLEGGKPTGTAKAVAKTAFKDANEIWKKPKENWDKSETTALDKVAAKNQFAAESIKFLLNQHRAKNKDKK